MATHQNAVCPRYKNAVHPPFAEGPKENGDEEALLKEIHDSVIMQYWSDLIPKDSGILTFDDDLSSPANIHVFESRLFLGHWSMIRESILVDGVLTRKEKEVLGAFISMTNECAFCTKHHILFAVSQGCDGDDLQGALECGDPMALCNQRLGEIIEWVMGAQNLQPGDLDTGLTTKSPSLREELPEVIGATFYFNYMNRVVDTFITQEALPPSIAPSMRFLMRASHEVLSMMEKKQLKHFSALKHIRLPGDALDLMDCSPELPEDFSWAESNEYIARAFAYFAWAIDEMAKKYIPINIVQFVGDYIKKKFRGYSIPSEDIVALTEGMRGTEAERIAAAFMIHVSFSRFQIDEKMRKDVETHYPDSETRRAFGMWSAFQTARKIAEWQGHDDLHRDDLFSDDFVMKIRNVDKMY